MTTDKDSDALLREAYRTALLRHGAHDHDCPAEMPSPFTGVDQGCSCGLAPTWVALEERRAALDATPPPQFTAAELDRAREIAATAPDTEVGRLIVRLVAALDATKPRKCKYGHNESGLCTEGHMLALDATNEHEHEVEGETLTASGRKEDCAWCAE